MFEREELVAALREEAEFWLEVPAGSPGQPAYQFPPMLFRLAEAIEKAGKR
jgi:hypothetical protein